MRVVFLPLEFLFLVLVSTPSSASAQVALCGGKCSVVFATVAEGKQVLGARDEYAQRMSPFDRAARLKTDREVSEEEYLKFAGDSVLAWEEYEMQTITAALGKVKAELDTFAITLPEKILLLKTTGDEEGNAAYTRAHAIVLPRRYLEEPEVGILSVLCHELFHIISRADPVLREKLYGAIGFQRCAEVFPPSLLPRKITNPDAPRNDCCIRLEVSGKPVWAMPILFSKKPKYDPSQGGDFFEYLEFKFLLMERGDDGAIGEVHEELLSPGLFQVRGVTGFFEQVGKNTNYIIHPEEILADNFSLLLLNARNVPSPMILEKMKAVLKK